MLSHLNLSLESRRDFGLDYEGIPTWLKERIHRVTGIDLKHVNQSGDGLWIVKPESGEDGGCYIVSRTGGALLMEGAYVCPGVKFVQGQQDSISPDASRNDDPAPDDEVDELAGCRPCKAFTVCGGACRHIYHCGCVDYQRGFTCKHILSVSYKLELWSPLSFFANPLQTPPLNNAKSCSQSSPNLSHDVNEDNNRQLNANIERLSRDVFIAQAVFSFVTVINILRTDLTI